MEINQIPYSVEGTDHLIGFYSRKRCRARTYPRAPTRSSGETQSAKYAFDEQAAEARYENVQTERERDDRTTSLHELFDAMKELIAPQLHARCAEVLAACTAIPKNWNDFLS